MRTVSFEKRGANGGYGGVNKRSVLRVGPITQKQRANLDLELSVLAQVYVLGRASLLARELEVGDRLDHAWVVIAVDASPTGQLLVTATDSRPC